MLRKLNEVSYFLDKRCKFCLDSPDRAALNLEKLIEKISSAEGIDPEYTSYISQFAEQVKQKETKAAETISKLQRELTSKNREVESLHDQLYDAQTNIGKIQSLEQALNDEKERFRDYTFSVNPKLAENYQVCGNFEIYMIGFVLAP